jgi:catechol 2,3-dioxygenase-like lactoylglutathione lyase family enzyme
VAEMDFIFKKEAIDLNLWKFRRVATMIKFKRLDHIQICIPTGKENEARKFYTDIIGLIEIPKPQPLMPNGGLWYQIADIQFHIGVESEINKSKRHPAFEVSNLDEAKQYLEKRGVPIKEEIQIPGQNRFSFIDPFGNRIELLQKFD